jgi:hypothetical protein
MTAGLAGFALMRLAERFLERWSSTTDPSARCDEDGVLLNCSHCLSSDGVVGDSTLAAMVAVVYTKRSGCTGSVRMIPALLLLCTSNQNCRCHVERDIGGPRVRRAVNGFLEADKSVRTVWWLYKMLRCDERRTDETESVSPRYLNPCW